MLKGITSCTLIAPFDPAAIHSDNSPNAEIAEEYLVDFLEFVKKQGLSNLIFVRYPHRSAAAHSDAVSQVEQVLSQYGHTLLNLENCVDEIDDWIASDRWRGDCV